MSERPARTWAIPADLLRTKLTPPRGHGRPIIQDIGGRWEAIFGSGASTVRLTSGGDVILVPDQEVVGGPPDYVVGKVEKPNDGDKGNPPSQ